MIQDSNKNKSIKHNNANTNNVTHKIDNIEILTNSPYGLMEDFGEDSLKVSRAVGHKKEKEGKAAFGHKDVYGRKQSQENIEKVKCTPIQAVTILPMVNKKSVVVRAPTGMGKTYAYLYPTIKNFIDDSDIQSRKISTIVLVPVKELAEQVREAGEVLIEKMLANKQSNKKESSFDTNALGYLKNKSIVDIFNSSEYLQFKLKGLNIGGDNSTTENTSKKSTMKISSLYGGKKFFKNDFNDTNILVATTGRLLDWITRGYFDLSHVKNVILDEADKMMDMGFKEDVDKILAFIGKNTTDYRLNCFSATYNKFIQDIIVKYMPSDYINISVQNEVVESIKQTFIKTHNKFASLLEILNKCKMDTSWATKSISDKVIIFVERKASVEKLKHKLLEVKNNKFFIDTLHGDMDQVNREIALKRFQMNSNILIATSVAARGIDVKDIKIVINYDLSKEIKEYIHRIGRTGREGKDGEAISFYSDVEDIGREMTKELVSVLKESNNEPVKEFDNAIANNFRSSYKSNKKSSTGYSKNRSNTNLHGNNNSVKKVISESVKKDDMDFAEKEDSDADCPNDEW